MAQEYENENGRGRHLWYGPGQTNLVVTTYASSEGSARGDNSIYFVWYRRAAGIAPFFQVIYTSIGHDFFSNIQL